MFGSFDYILDMSRPFSELGGWKRIGGCGGEKLALLDIAERVVRSGRHRRKCGERREKK